MDKYKKIFDAIVFAAKAHACQFRKGTTVPYIIHPVGVARILIEYGCPEDIVIAGLLHDTIEDTAVTLEDIQKEFGDDIAGIVRGATEPNKKDAWEDRKKHTL